MTLLLRLGAGCLALAFVMARPAHAQIQTDATHAALVDFETGEVLFCKNCDEPMPPSSMSKLMTVELVFQRLKDARLKLSDTFHVSEKAWRQGQTSNESKMWVDVNSDVSVEDLLKGIIVQSGGDACVVVAEALAGSEAAFADMSNRRAAELGLTKSHFVNATGLPDPNHYMSALDLSRLAAHIVREYPDYYHYFAIPEFTWGGIRQPNRNTLVTRNVGIDGLKTGHTLAAGYGLTASAQRDGQRLMLVVNGLSSENRRIAEVQRLFDLGFREFKRYDIVALGDVLGDVSVFGGTRDRVGLTVAEPLSLTLSVEARREMKVSLRYRTPVKAPIARGQELGTLTVSAPGRPDATVPVVAAEDISATGFFGHMVLGVRDLIGADS